MGVANSVWRERLEVWIKNFGDKDFNRVINGYKGQIGRLKVQLDKAKKSGQGFNQNMKRGRMVMAKWLGVGLSVMFISMGISAAFSRMLQPALDVLGMFDIWKALMISILVPILLPFVSMLIDLFNYIGKHPALKKFIGWLIVIGFLFFTVLQMLAQVAILVGTFVAIGGSIALFGTLLTIAGAITLAIIAIINLFMDWGNWIKFIIKLVGAIGIAIAVILLAPIEASIAVIALIIGALVVIYFLIVDNFTAIIDWLKVNWAKYLVKILLAPFQPVLMLLKSIMNFIDKIKGTNLMSSKFGKMLDFASFGEGGIVTKPTLALIGERGPEAVVPLTGAEAGSGGVNIALTINGNFSDAGGPGRLASLIQSVLRDELRRLGVR